MNTLKILFASLLLPVVLHAGDAPKPAGKPNILILLADDMGYGDPGCYNPKSKIATPHIDRLAREGMRFTDAQMVGIRDLQHFNKFVRRNCGLSPRKVREQGVAAGFVRYPT